MQDSYIGNTTASQAVKAGSTPVSCSKTKGTPKGCLLFWADRESNNLNAGVRWTVARRRLDDGGSLILSTPVSCSNKKVPFVYQTKGTFLSDAFLRNEMRTACVIKASPVMHTFGACMERIASPITAQLHHLLLICKHT